jgi:hypothetical protein
VTSFLPFDSTVGSSNFRDQDMGGAVFGNRVCESTSQKNVFLLRHGRRKMYCDHQCQGWRRSKQGRFGIKSLVVAAAFAAFVFSPASAKMMPCTGENIAKITASIDTMPETPRKMAMIKEDDQGDWHGQY